MKKSTNETMRHMNGEMVDFPKESWTKDELTLSGRGFTHYNNGVWTKPTSSMLEDEWLAERDNGLGGSDIGIILGFSKYKSAVELFREKVGVVDAPQLRNRQVFFGHRSENDVLDLGQYYDFTVKTLDYKWEDAWLENAYEKNKLRSITPFENIVVNTRYPWIQANVDSLTNHDTDKRMAECVAEAKNTTIMANKGYIGWVNPTYVCQCVTYSFVLEPMLTRGGTQIYQKFDGNQLFARYIPTFEAQWLVDDILNESFEFYNNVIKGREIVENASNMVQALRGIREIEPRPDDSERYTRFIDEDFLSMDQYSSRQMTEDEYQLLIEYSENDAKAKELLTKKRKAENILKKNMTDSASDEILYNDGSRIRWKNKFTPKLIRNET